MILFWILSLIILNKNCEFVFNLLIIFVLTQLKLITRAKLECRF